MGIDKNAFFSCEMGAAGDMLVAVVLDALAGGPRTLAEVEEAKRTVWAPWMEQMSSALQIEKGGRVEISVVKRAKQEALKVSFFVGETSADHHHAHSHRHYTDIVALLDSFSGSGVIPLQVIDLSKKIFLILGEAEALAHEVPLEKVHFHEVGAFDSIMDIVGFAAAYVLLGPKSASCSAIETGSGSVMTSHGELNVPVPAVQHVLAAYPMETKQEGLRGEFLTPTGAAILAAIVDDSRQVVPAGDFVWYQGAGSRNPENKANVVSMALC